MDCHLHPKGMVQTIQTVCHGSTLKQDNTFKVCVCGHLQISGGGWEHVWGRVDFQSAFCVCVCVVLMWWCWCLCVCVFVCVCVCVSVHVCACVNQSVCVWKSE